MSRPICTRTRSQMRLRRALRTPQSEITINIVGLFSSPSRSGLLDEPHEVVAANIPSIIPATDFFYWNPLNTHQHLHRRAISTLENPQYRPLFQRQQLSPI